MKTIFSILIACCLQAVLQASAQTNEPPSGSPPPPPLDEGQTWEDWTQSYDYKRTIIRSSENPVTNIAYIRFDDYTNAPASPTEEQLAYAQIWTKPKPLIVRSAKVVEPVQTYTLVLLFSESPGTRPAEIHFEVVRSTSPTWFLDRMQGATFAGHREVEQ